MVGKLTYGKGVGYSMLPSYQKGAIIFTNAMVFDRNHQTYHMYGILPDVDESISTAMMDSALAIAKEGKRERTAGYASVVQNKYMVLSKRRRSSQSSRLETASACTKSPTAARSGKLAANKIYR